MKHMSGHLRNSGTKKAYDKPSAKSEPKSVSAVNSPKGMTAIDADYGAEEKSHPHAGVPHPMTGVKSIRASHIGNGRYVTETEHDGGESVSDEHENASSMHAHMAQHMPDEAMDHEDLESPKFESAEESGAMSALGGSES